MRSRSPQAAPEEPVSRLPWPAVAGALVALAALCITGQGPGSIPPAAALLGALLVLPSFTALRIDNRILEWCLRAVYFVFVYAATMNGPDPPSDGLINGKGTYLFGQLLVAELVLQSWRRHPEGGNRGVMVIGLSGLVLLAASNTFEWRYLTVLAPTCILLLAFACRAFRPPERGETPSDPRLVRGWPVQAAALAAAFAIGGAMHYGLHTYRSQLMEWSNELLLARMMTPTSGIAGTPELGASYDVQLSAARVLRIENLTGDLAIDGGDPSHWRGASHVDYNYGRWGPALPERSYVPVDAGEVRSDARGPRVRVTRFQDDYHLLFEPLHAAGLDAGQGTELRWSTAPGVTLRGQVGWGYLRYDVVLASDRHLGPFCPKPEPRELQQCLAVPRYLSDRLRGLTNEIARGARTPEEKIGAVEQHLLSHHRYSLRVTPGRGDPILSFLTEGKAAHCQYFATGAVVLLRVLGVPARYASGFYAHESGGKGVTIVRQRDAHAWAEAWVEGRGWVTVDATPDDGRPDQLWDDPPPFFLSITEWLQDRLLGLLNLLSHPGSLILPLGIVVAIGLGLVLWRRFHARGAGTAALFSYSSPGEELAALARRFEARLAQAGLRCPEGQTWTEYLAALERHPPNPAPALDLGRASAFLGEYNAVRFGRPADREALALLRERLRELETA